MEFIDLKQQYQRYQPEIDTCMRRVLEHDHFIMGPEIAEVEVALPESLSKGSKNCDDFKT